MLRFYQGVFTEPPQPPTHPASGATQLLTQPATSHADPGPQQQQPAPEPPPSKPGPSGKRVKKVTTSAKPCSVQHHGQRSHPPVTLSTIPPPCPGDKRPLIVTMGLEGRHKCYVRIRVCGRDPISKPDSDLPDLPRAGFVRSHSIPGSIGQEHGHKYPQAKRLCSFRWSVI